MAFIGLCVLSCMINYHGTVSTTVCDRVRCCVYYRVPDHRYPTNTSRVPHVMYQTWCNGGVNAECSQVSGAACTSSQCSESGSTDGSCADACCKVSFGYVLLSYTYCLSSYPPPPFSTCPSQPPLTILRATGPRQLLRFEQPASMQRQYNLLPRGKDGCTHTALHFTSPTLHFSHTACYTHTALLPLRALLECALDHVR